MFEPGSRYEHVADAVYVDRNGRQFPYKLLRTFPGDAPLRQLYDVTDHDRLDLLSFRFYGDPEQFWRLCDGNRALLPDELEVEGLRIRVPLAVR
jgi:hypothetical protein